MLIPGLIWTFVLAAWVPAAVIALPLAFPEGPGQGAFALLLTLVGIVVLGTFALGFVVSLKLQLRWIWIAALTGTTAQLFGYVVGMIEVPQPNGAEDIAAGAGFVVLSLPTLLMLTALSLDWGRSGPPHRLGSFAAGSQPKVPSVVLDPRLNRTLAATSQIRPVKDPLTAHAATYRSQNAATQR